MITVKDDCEKCVHRKVCKHPAISKNMAERLSNTKYNPEPKVEETWDDITKQNEITIEISCPHFMCLPVGTNEGVRIVNKGTSMALVSGDQEIMLR